MKKILAIILAMTLALSCMSVMSVAAASTPADPLITVALSIEGVSPEPCDEVDITGDGEYSLSVDNVSKTGSQYVLIKNKNVSSGWPPVTQPSDLPNGTKITITKLVVNGITATFGDTATQTYTYTEANNGAVEITIWNNYLGGNASNMYLDGTRLDDDVRGNLEITSMTVDFTVELPVDVTGVSLDEETLDLETGDTKTLAATIAPENATFKGVTWASDNETVATVVDGLVTAVNPGTANITVTTDDGGFTDTCVVTVTAPAGFVDVEAVELDVNGMSLKVGESDTLIATVTPDDATNQTVFWSSDNEAVAIVDELGNVTAVGVGTATITVTTESGSKTDTCTVNVTLPMSGTLVDTDFDDDTYGEWNTNAGGTGHFSIEEGVLMTKGRWNGATITYYPLGALVAGTTYTAQMEVLIPSFEGCGETVSITLGYLYETGFDKAFISKNFDIPVDTPTLINLSYTPKANATVSYIGLWNSVNIWSSAFDFGIDNAVVTYQQPALEIPLTLPTIAVGDTLTPNMMTGSDYLGGSAWAFTPDADEPETEDIIAEEAAYYAFGFIYLDGEYTEKDVDITVNGKPVSIVLIETEDDVTYIEFYYEVDLTKPADSDKNTGWFCTGETYHAMIIGRAIISLPHEFNAEGTCIYCRYHVELTEEDVEIEVAYESETEETEEDVVVEDENPTTGLALALVTMAVAAAAVISKRR